MDQKERVYSLDNIVLNPKLCLSKASMAEIMVAVKKSQDRDATDPWQEMFIAEFKEKIPSLVKKYEEMLVPRENKRIIDYNKDLDLGTRVTNLYGSLPPHVEIKPKKHRKIKLSDGHMGAFVQAMFQRLDYMLYRPIPQFYQKNKAYKPYFYSLREDIWKFRYELICFKRFYDRLKDRVKAHKHALESAKMS